MHDVKVTDYSTLLINPDVKLLFYMHIQINRCAYRKSITEDFIGCSATYIHTSFIRA